MFISLVAICQQAHIISQNQNSSEYKIIPSCNAGKQNIAFKSGTTGMATMAMTIALLSML